MILMISEQKIIETLFKYPAIASLGFSSKSIINCKNSNEEFVLRDILERENEPYWNTFLTKLNDFVYTTNKIYSSKKKLRDKICSSPFSTMWELEFASYCISKNISIVEEVKTVDNSNVDFKISLDGSDVLVEAHVRRLKKKEEKEHATVGNITRSLVDTITEKINQNEIPSNMKLPLILAIDGNYAGIDSINVESFFDFKSEDFYIVSGIFLKNTSRYTFIQNPNAKNPLTTQQISKLID